jgi:hypothetical protein
MRIDDNIANGMLPDDARRDAYMRFGNRTVIKERVAGEDAALVVENVWRDSASPAGNCPNPGASPSRPS